MPPQRQSAYPTPASLDAQPPACVDPTVGVEDVEATADLAAATDATLARAARALADAREVLRENNRTLRALVDAFRDEREQRAINEVSSDLFRAVGRGSG